MGGVKFYRSRGSIGVGLVALLGVLAITWLFFAVVVIESGNVGVKKTLGKIQPEKSPRGFP